MRPLLILAALLLAGRAAAAEPARFALLVGSNVGDPHEPLLHHAEDDATRVAQTVRTLGDFPTDHVLLMTGATAGELREALIGLNARLREERGAVLVVFYSGHADAEALHLAGTHLPMSELKGLLVGSPALLRVLIVDACRSGTLTLKGAAPAPTFVVPPLDEPIPEGFAVLTSSAATEDSQESAALRSSFFTYYLNSGLIGGADQDRDGAVTLSELYAFTSAGTRAATARTLGGPQNPTFQFRLGGRRDLVLTRPGRRDVREGILRFAQAGRYEVQRWEPAGLSPPVAEVAASDAGMQVALPPGRYRVTLRGDRAVSEHDCAVAGGEITTVDPAQMSRIDVGRVVRKGGTRPSATGFALLAGWHSDEIGPANKAMTLGDGPSLLLAARHDRRSLSLEARLAFEQGVVPGPEIEITNRVFSPTLALLVPFDWRTVTLSFGLQAGLALVRQNFRVRDDQGYRFLIPATGAQAGRWATGGSGGAIVQLDFPLGERAYLRLESAMSARVFRGSPASNGSDHPAGIHFNVVGGAGAAF
jgi:hypothetical protein